MENGMEMIERRNGKEMEEKEIVIVMIERGIVTGTKEGGIVTGTKEGGIVMEMKEREIVMEERKRVQEVHPKRIRGLHETMKETIDPEKKKEIDSLRMKNRFGVKLVLKSLQKQLFISPI